MVVGPACFGRSKVHWAEDLGSRRSLDLDKSWFYTDSYTDLPMLEAVGNPVAVNPDRDLRREAEKRRWQVRYFRRPVRLRHRLVRAVPKPSPLAAAATAFVVVAVFAWVFLRPRWARS